MTLLEIRTSLNLSQRAAAKALGIDQPTYCRLEAGKGVKLGPKRIERVRASGAPRELVDAVLGAG